MPKTLDLRVLADDLTGALDTAAMFSPGVLVHLGRPPAQAAEPRAGAVTVVATATRDIAMDNVPAALAPCIAWLAGARIAFKKVDSLLRGNTFHEVIHVAREGGFRRVVFAPSLPAEGRWWIDGNLKLNHSPVVPTKTGMARSPVSGSDAPGHALAKALEPLGIELIAPNVDTGGALEALVAREWDQTAHRSTLWCGSAGLAEAMVNVLGFHHDGPCVEGEQDSLNHAALGAHASSLLVVSASQHPVTRSQWPRVLAAHPHAHRAGGVDAEQLDQSLDDVILRWQSGAAAAGVSLLDLAPTAPLTAPEAARRLSERMARIVKHAPRPTALCVVGGDTLLALCRATGTSHLKAQASLRRGWGHAQLQGGTWSGVHGHSRSGAFGDEHDLAQLVQTLMRSVDHA